MNKKLETTMDDTTAIANEVDPYAKTTIGPRPFCDEETRIITHLGNIRVEMPIGDLKEINSALSGKPTEPTRLNAGAFVRPGYEGDPAKGTVQRSKASRSSLWKAGNFLAELAMRYFRRAGENEGIVEPLVETHTRQDFIEYLLIDWSHVSTGWDSESSGNSWMHFSHRVLEGTHMLYSLREGKACLMLPSRAAALEQDPKHVALIERLKTEFSDYVKEVEFYVA